MALNIIQIKLKNTQETENSLKIRYQCLKFIIIYKLFYAVLKTT